MGMKIEQGELLNGERIVLERGANLLINLKDYGLKNLKYIPFQKKEGIGGKLYLTNYRLIFKPHLFNRVKGTYSLLLHNIESTKDTSFLLMRKIEVRSHNKPYEFVVGKREELLSSIDKLKRNISTEDKINLERLIIDNGLTKFTEMAEIINVIFELM